MLVWVCSVIKMEMYNQNKIMPDFIDKSVNLKKKMCGARLAKNFEGAMLSEILVANFSYK
jgi:hypothetical protein